MNEVLERLERIEQKMDARFEQVDRRFEQVDKRFEQVDKRFDQVDRRFEQVDKRFEQVDRRFDQVDRRFEKVDEQLHRQGLLLESLNGNVQLALEGISGNRAVMDARFSEVLAKLDERIQPVEAASRHFARSVTALAQGKPGRKNPRG